MVELTPVQKKTIELLAHSKLKDKFYWSGGTLLAHYYLGHRRSLDLDFFTDQKFTFNEVNQFVQSLKKKINFKRVFSQKIFDRWEFLLENKDFLRIEFVYYNQQRRALEKKKKYLGVLIDSLKDLAANKTMAYLDRNEAKDLFDLYFLIKKGKFSPIKLLKLVKEKFGVEISEGAFWSEVFKGLALLGEIKPLMIESSEKEKDLLLKKIQTYFREGSREFLGKKVS